MGLTRRVLAATAVLLLGALYSLGPAFLTFSPVAGHGGSASLETGAGAASTSTPSLRSSAPHSAGQAEWRVFPGVALAASVALLAAAERRFGQKKADTPSTSMSSFVDGNIVPIALGSDAAGFAHSSPVALRSVRTSCADLFFKRVDPIYEARHRDNLRNRAYNVYMTIKYRRAVRPVKRYGKSLISGETRVASVAEAIDKIKGELDNACLTVDEVCTQGVIHRKEAGEIKDNMLKIILRGCINQGLIEKPEDPFVPAYKTLGYTLPESFFLREPRPWQLPGWKSPWMLKREFDKWAEKKEKENA
mmetsp:Transcript_22527/g.49780  ORF Transcript_22527/g.49780 Transcript_22527/m.49780 type:complete len:305 (-) Transcript_22527:132-1046(-)|eukprot:CAMPEP_0170619238 /NCGR_PEP_ID=MMETSP0224-20130122/27410_1 /TAXON_ID=285029 /ORGANISM="Togula jolla, Strain CCCM 725" /LENGTH=304 /DNA_ID=CAMNT_0010945315 /DNA_START=36 /DNA_END=950 /DNA_ORIENTATION=-